MLLKFETNGEGSGDTTKLSEQNSLISQTLMSPVFYIFLSGILTSKIFPRISDQNFGDENDKMSAEVRADGNGDTTTLSE